ncbi:hypothetical protein QWZ03_08995 [Chitinimonas viridis]|uniref:HEAT repeat domain-containing protein n=1 Tax=Chitinimonas viridis TaxID=664880 RepID=A0ABT8B4G7_9NEIS|nr:hypothetical protein [Chitinimonas viridis]MBL8508660.1 hypothetical protein [Chitinimonas sp.]MDN3576900.1 hypothetical protein [Chitinimonas viridis]
MIGGRLLFAASLDIGALGALITGEAEPLRVTLLLASHALACVVFSFTGLHFLPPHYRFPARAPLLLFFSLCFFIPGISVLGILLAVILARFVKREEVFAPFGEVEPPNYRSGRGQSPRAYAAGGVKALMFNPSARTDIRMKALLTTQAMPRRLANPLLHEALSGDVDDIRLVAYGILANQEREIAEHIHRLNHEEPADDKARLDRDRSLAQLNWELVHNRLVQGDMRRHTLAQAERYALSCLDRMAEDAGLWMLLGKIRLENNQADAALPCFMAAQAFGQPVSSVVPYLAELAWRKKNYQEVRRLMAQLPAEGQSPLVNALQRYWTQTA